MRAVIMDGGLKAASSNKLTAGSVRAPVQRKGKKGGCDARAERLGCVNARVCVWVPSIYIPRKIHGLMSL